ncbi:MAG: exo-alpha-sialidase [Dehalococcoidia bacterium]
MGVSVIVGTSKGMAVARSDEARERWDVEALQLPGWAVTAATRDSSGRTYIGVASDIYGAAVMSSDDLTTWTQCDGAPRYEEGDRGNLMHQRIVNTFDFEGKMTPEHRFVDQIWRLKAVGDTVYAGVSEAGLFRSTDGGASWKPLKGLNEHPSREGWFPGAGGMGAHSILVEDGPTPRMWVGISAAGVFRSDDGGETWEAKNEGINGDAGFCVHGLAHDPAHPDVIYRQDHRGYYISHDAGDSWEQIEHGLPQAELSDGRRSVFGFASAFDPKTHTAFAIPMSGDSFRFPIDGKLRVYRTTDEGASWQPNASGLPDGCYANVLRGAISLDGLDPCGVYFGTSAGAVHISNDVGETWTTLPQTFPRVLCVAAFAD